MAGKFSTNNENAKPPSTRVAQHESIHTLNVILQQSALLSINAHLQNKIPPILSRKSCQYLQILARKATLRVDVSIKRSICSRCQTILLPGITCSKRIQASKPCDLVMITRCNICGHKMRLPCPAVQSKRFKAQARKHQKSQRKLETLNMNRKVKCFAKTNLNADQPKIAMRVDGSMKPVKLSQRARRRAAKTNAEALNGKQYDHKTKKRKRRKQNLSFANVRKGVNEDDGRQDRVLIQSSRNSKVIRGKRPVKKQSEMFKLDLPPYADRLKRQANQGSSWTDSLPHDLTEQQRKALGMFRGDHFVTVGLGRGGVVGDVL